MRIFSLRAAGTVMIVTMSIETTQGVELVPTARWREVIEGRGALRKSISGLPLELDS